MSRDQVHNIKGRLLLIPAPISENITAPISAEVAEILRGSKYIITEGIRSTRRYLKAVDKAIDINAIVFFELVKKAPPDSDFLAPCYAGHDVLFCSEAGLPCIADPGAGYVNLARKQGIGIKAYAGPSSIMQALMLSGFNGQRFEFHGYLPIDRGELKNKLKELERESKVRNKAQIFIETPYRNRKMCEAMHNCLSPQTEVAIMVDLDTERELQLRITANLLPQIYHHFNTKRPAVFLLQNG